MLVKGWGTAVAQWLRCCATNRKVAGSIPHNVIGIFFLLDEFIQRKNIIRFIKSQRLKWLGHVERMQKEREVKKIYKWKPFASRPIGRPKNRWEDDVRKDLQTMKFKNWKRSVLDRDLWKKIVDRTKTHTEL